VKPVSHNDNLTVIVLVLAGLKEALLKVDPAANVVPLVFSLIVNAK
jgi:hypothetical protein